MADATSFLNSIWRGVKDAANYVYSAGNKPYLVDCTVTFKASAPDDIPYWYSYKSAFEGKSPVGYFERGKPLRNLGIGTYGSRKRNPGETVVQFYNARAGKVFFDTLIGDAKAVFQYDPSIMDVKETHTAFQLTAEKEKALQNMQRSLDLAVASLGQLALTINAQVKKVNTLNAAQKQLLKQTIDDYNAKAIALSNDSDIEISLARIEYPRGLQGLGAEPVSSTVVIVAVIAVSVVTYATIQTITSKIAAYSKYKAEVDLQKTGLEAKLKVLGSDASADVKAAQVKAIDESLAKGQERIEQNNELEKQESESNNLFSTLKTLSYVALTGGALYAGVKLIPLFTSKKAA